MAFEIEIPDEFSSWGAAGKHFRPGIWPVTDGRIVEAARRAGFVVRETSTPDAGVAFEEHPDKPGGTLTRADMLGDAHPVKFDCPVPGCGRSYKTEANREAHLASAHPDYEPEEPVAEEPVAEQPFTGVPEGTPVDGDADGETDPFEVT